MTDNFDFYKTIIYQTRPRTERIWTPRVSGAKQNVLMTQESDGHGYAFKFSTKNYSIRNANIAQALRNADIPAPEIVAQNCDNQWFEICPIIPGKTLYECVGNGAINRTELKSIYCELLKLIEKMSHIDFSDIDFCNMQYAYQTAYNDTAQTNGVLMASIVSAAVRIMNADKKSSRGLYHHGMTPKNIMISSHGKISGILDIDEVGICNKNYALGVLLAKARLLGLDTTELCKNYERISGQQINRAQISAIIALQNFGRNILYKTK